MNPATHQAELLEYLAALLLLLGQVLLFHGRTGLQTAWAPVALLTLTLLLALTAPLCLLARRWRRWALFGTVLMLTGLLYADLLFFRFFGRAIPLPALTGVSQVAGVTRSIRAVMASADLLFLLAPLLLLAGPWWLDRATAKPAASESPSTEPLPLPYRVTTGLLVYLVGLGGTAGLASGAKLFQPETLQQLYGDNRVLSQGGVLAYHVTDGVRHLRAPSLGAAPLDAVHLPRGSEKNPWQGVAQGKNLILIQLEATEAFILDRRVNGQEITPNLNRFRQEALWFPQFYSQVGGGNTSDAEFVTLNSLHALTAGAAYVRKAGNQYHSLAHVLSEQGYQTHAFHGYQPTFWNRNRAYPALGFQGVHLGQDFFAPGLSFNMGLADHLFFGQIATYLQGVKQPFFAFMVTLSGHHPYDIPPPLRKLQLPPGAYADLMAAYLQNQHYVDAALGQFFAELKRTGLWDSSVIVIYGDHAAAGVKAEEIRRLTGAPAPLAGPDEIELRTVPLLVRLPGGELAGTRPAVGGQLDIFPTLANLLGLPNEGSFYLGRDLLTAREGAVALRYFWPDGSFISERYRFVASSGGQLVKGSCLDRTRRVLVPPTECAAGYEQARRETAISDQIVEGNQLPRLLQRNSSGAE
jgi:lipoteichoic acid synthase